MSLTRLNFFKAAYTILEMIPRARKKKRRGAVYAAYAKLLKAYNMLDFDTSISSCVVSVLDDVNAAVDEAFPNDSIFDSIWCAAGR